MLLNFTKLTTHNLEQETYSLFLNIKLNNYSNIKLFSINGVNDD